MFHLVPRLAFAGSYRCEQGATRKKSRQSVMAHSRYYKACEFRRVARSRGIHFLTDSRDRTAYVRQVVKAIKHGGQVIVSTFGPEGPKRCSGLNVVRYDAESLHNEFGKRFRLLESSKQLHHTPFGTLRQFLYCWCRME
jgi:hypothetical protein